MLALRHFELAVFYSQSIFSIVGFASELFPKSSDGDAFVIPLCLGGLWRTVHCIFHANSLVITETVDCKYSAFRRFWSDQDDIEYEDAFSQQVLVSAGFEVHEGIVVGTLVRMKLRGYASDKKQ